MPEKFDAAVLEEKVEKGEELTPEEEKALMQAEEGEEIAPEEPEKKAGKEEAEAGKKKEAEEEDESEEEKPEEPSKKKEPEETPSEKDAEAAKAKAKEAEDAQNAEERRKQIEAEAEKPLDEADLENYSPTERALFFELRKERRKRQESQREADTLKFERMQREIKEREERDRQERERREKEAKDPFEGLDEEEFLTVKQVKNILTNVRSEKKEASDTKPALDLQEQNQRLLLRAWQLEGQLKHPDLLEVLKHADTLLAGDKEAEAEVAEVIRKGGNAAIATYHLIKSHPKWTELSGQSKKKESDEEKKKKEEEARINKERAERIEKNKTKTPTTGTGGGAAPAGDYTVQEILDMSEEEFAALPKAKRDKILEMYG